MQEMFVNKVTRRLTVVVEWNLESSLILQIVMEKIRSLYS